MKNPTAYRLPALVMCVFSMVALIQGHADLRLCDITGLCLCDAKSEVTHNRCDCVDCSHSGSEDGVPNSNDDGASSKDQACCDTCCKLLQSLTYLPSRIFHVLTANTPEFRPSVSFQPSISDYRQAVYRPPRA
ncbi:MAG: hypothetical protein V2B18_10915 [Pseudomonadota bacterium]